MLLKIYFNGVKLTVDKILKPKSKFVEYLKAKEGDIFNLDLKLGMSRRYATYITITNISHPDKPSKVVSQEELFGVINRTFEFKEEDYTE